MRPPPIAAGSPGESPDGPVATLATATPPAMPTSATPIVAAMVTSAQAARRWLDRQPPHLEEARQALARIVNDGNRGGAIIARIRALINKESPRKDRVDINDVVARIDMERLVEQTDLGAIIARSTGGLATRALDTMRSGAVGLDRRIGRWVTRLLRRKEPGPLAPPALLGLEAQP